VNVAFTFLVNDLASPLSIKTLNISINSSDFKLGPEDAFEVDELDEVVFFSLILLKFSITF